MKIIPLKKNDKQCCCRSYLLLGDWNRIADINTVIDPGGDDFIVSEIERLSAGFGNIAVSQVILTHNPLGHAGGIQALRKRYNARVLAFRDGAGVDRSLIDGQFVKAGDATLEVLHTPGHSPDSICLYAPSEKAIFSGDTQLRVMMPGEMYPRDYIDGLMKIACRDVLRIFPGHDNPITSGCQEMILHTVRNLHLKATASGDRRYDFKKRLSIQA